VRNLGGRYLTGVGGRTEKTGYENGGEGRKGQRSSRGEGWVRCAIRLKKKHGEAGVKYS